MITATVPIYFEDNGAKKLLGITKTFKFIYIYINKYKKFIFRCVWCRLSGF